MASGGLANSKNALIFAGSVIVCAALAAGSLGKNFTPDTETEQVAQRDPSTSSPVPSKSKTTAHAEETQDRVFGEYDGGIDESDLIDDTSGFDPTPTDTFAVVIEDRDSDESATKQGTSRSAPVRREASSTDSASVSETNARQRLLDARKRLRERRPVSDDDEDPD